MKLDENESSLLLVRSLGIENVCFSYHCAGAFIVWHGAHLEMEKNHHKGIVKEVVT